MSSDAPATPPAALGRIHEATGTPRVALAVNLVVGLIAILSGRTGEIITLACFGAVSLYVLSMIALLRLRKTEPELERPFRAVLYPVFPITALVLAAVCLVAMTWSAPMIAAVFAGLVGVGVVYFFVAVRGKIDESWSR